MNTFVTQLRCPESLAAALKAAAEGAGRSMNAEIVKRLEVSLQVQAQADLYQGSQIVALADALEKELRKRGVSGERAA